MYCTEFYLCGVLHHRTFYNTGLKVCCTHASLSGHTCSDSLMDLCEICSALVGQDMRRRRNCYSYGHSVHSCLLPTHKRNWKTNSDQNWTVIFLQSFGKSGEIPSLLKFCSVTSITTSVGHIPLSPETWTGSCFRSWKWKNTGGREREEEPEIFTLVLPVKALYWWTISWEIENRLWSLSIYQFMGLSSEVLGLPFISIKRNFLEIKWV